MEYPTMTSPALRTSIFSPTRPEKADAGELKSPLMTSKEPPACVQNAMINKEKKPFTYTPGGLDLSQIRSEKMARRLMINAMSPGVQERPVQPSFTPTCESPSIKASMNYYNLPVAVFPMVQIPTNPKELLRRTGGPYNRSDSIEKEENSTKEIETKNSDCIPEQKEPAIELIDTESKKISNDTSKEIKEKSNELIDVDDKNCSETTLEVGQNVLSDTKAVAEQASIQDIIEDITSNDKTHIDLNPPPTPEKQVSPIILESPIINDRILEGDGPKQEILKIENENNTDKSDVMDLKDHERISPERTDEDGDITPKIDVETKLFESILSEFKKKEAKDKDEKVSAVERNVYKKSIQSNPAPSVTTIDKKDDVFMRENRDSIACRRSSENIKSLNCDLDSLPSLSLCSKRFSFLSEGPTKNEDDPFSIITGIPPKISLIDRSDKRPSPEKQRNNEILPPWKPKNIPYKNPKETIRPYEPKDSQRPTWKPTNNISSQKSVKSFIESSPQTNNYNEAWKNDSWCKPEPIENLIPVNIKIDDDNEPAWKRELRDIANQKREQKDDNDFYKEEVEPPWRRELRELSQSRKSKDSSPLYSKPDTENVCKPTYKLNYSRSNIEDSSTLSTNNPLWSQTVRPKTWRERKADLARDKEVEIPEWKKIGDLRRNVVNSFINKSTPSSSSCSSPAREIRKTPEITVEIAGNPTSTPAGPLNSNGYTYPWESSSESSTAFSPEPYLYDRTPTPQSRNSPFRQAPYLYTDMQSPAIPREYGTLSYQPNYRQQMKSCPIQSRSFKYLQLLTGTTDTYEDDEPFIPQSPLHAHLRPDNL